MAPPALFTTESFERAAATARAQGRLLLVDFTAEWCAPCKNMDQTTWLDASVIGWVSQHAIAVQLDVDQHDALSKRFDVRAMPTLVLLRGDELLDRVTGARPAAALLDWLEAARGGRKEVDLLRDALDPGNPSSWMDLARHLIDAGRLDEALPHVEELWLKSVEVEPAFVGVRLSFLINLIAQLVRALPAARARFEALRDELTPRLATDERAGADWFALNDALEDEARSLAWLDEVKLKPPPWVAREYRVQTLLIGSQRWADLGRLLHDPVADLTALLGRQQEFVANGLPEEDVEELRRWFTSQCREQAQVLIRSLRAAGRDPEAAEVQRLARERDPSDEMRVATEVG
ncbi:MAG: thioredoxin family protein [Myxococcaceae bacterium]|nr:thioredoxin family protein [Myxococcaceae bacterium]